MPRTVLLVLDDGPYSPLVIQWTLSQVIEPSEQLVIATVPRDLTFSGRSTNGYAEQKKQATRELELRLKQAIMCCKRKSNVSVTIRAHGTELEQVEHCEQLIAEYQPRKIIVYLREQGWVSKFVVGDRLSALCRICPRKPTILSQRMVERLELMDAFEPGF